MINCEKIKISVFLIILLLINLVPLHTTYGKDTIKDIINRDRAIAADKAGYSAVESAVNLIELQAKYLQTVLSFLGVVFLALIIYGGFIWMNAHGDSEEVKKSKDIMINAVIGLGIVLASYAISEYIISKLVEVATLK